MLLPATPAMLYVGPVAALPPDNRPSAICKTPLQAPTWLGQAGLVGDAQADRRVHGGPENKISVLGVQKILGIKSKKPAKP